MNTFRIIATRQCRGRVAYEMEATIEVQANSLIEAYKAIRALPEFKFAFLRPE